MSVVLPLTFAIFGVFMIVAAQQIGRDARRVRPIGGMTLWGARAIGALKPRSILPSKNQNRVSLTPSRKTVV